LQNHRCKTANIKILPGNAKERIEASFYIYDRPLTDMKVIASMCIEFEYIKF